MYRTIISRYSLSACSSVEKLSTSFPQFNPRGENILLNTICKFVVIDDASGCFILIGVERITDFVLHQRQPLHSCTDVRQGLWQCGDHKWQNDGCRHDNDQVLNLSSCDDLCRQRLAEDQAAQDTGDKTSGMCSHIDLRDAHADNRVQYDKCRHILQHLISNASGKRITTQDHKAQ